MPLQNVRSTLRLAATRPSGTFSDLQYWWQFANLALPVPFAVIYDANLFGCFSWVKQKFAHGERVAPGEPKQNAWPEFDSWSVGGQASICDVW